MKLELSQFDGFAFDFDGTLADSLGAHTEAHKYAFPIHGVHTLTDEHHRQGQLCGNMSTTITAGLLRMVGLMEPDADPNIDELVQKIVATKNQYYLELACRGLPEKPGSTDFFKAMADKIGPENVCIVTTASRQEVMPFVEHYELERILSDERLITIETVTELGLRPKPSEDAYLVAAERMGVGSADKMLVVEDSQGGIISGKRAGAMVLAMGRNDTTEVFQDGETEYRYDYSAPSFYDIELIA